MTASISRNAFFYGMTESLGETAIAATLTTARYSVLAYDLVTSDEARQTYRWVSQMTVALGQLAFWSTVWAWAKVQRWAEAEVVSCLPTEPDHIADAGKMVEADPFAPEANPAYAAVVATQPKEPTIRELKRMASEARIKGYGTMSKAQLMEALAIA